MAGSTERDRGPGTRAPYDAPMRRGTSSGTLAGLLLAACAAAGPTGSTRVRVAGASLFVHDAGTGPPLLVAGAAWMERDLAPLEERRRVVAYDPRGRGRSSPLAASAEPTLADDVGDLEALRAELGLERFSLLAWSYGAAIALRYAMAHPERVESLVLVAPFPPRRDPWWQELGSRFRVRADPAVFRHLEEMRASGEKARDPYGYCRAVAGAFFRTYAADATAFQRMQSDPCAPPNLDPEATARLAQAIVERLGAWDWRAELERLDLPVLIVHGDHDVLPAGSSREYAALLPRGVLLELEGVGHFPWLESPERFFTPVLTFLAEGRL